jgi:hypothetical protein
MTVNLDSVPCHRSDKTTYDSIGARELLMRIAARRTQLHAMCNVGRVINQCLHATSPSHSVYPAGGSTSRGRVEDTHDLSSLSPLPDRR